MKPYQRHTQLTHHILEEDDYNNYYDYYHNEAYEIDWRDDNVDYDLMPPKEEVYQKRWRNIPISSPSIKFRMYSGYRLVDMKSFYSKDKKRDMVLGEIFGDIPDTRNTIESMV